MVTHQDDVVTRMKNVDMIELGKHKIKPWYFAPYPQVSDQLQTFFKIKKRINFHKKHKTFVQGDVPNALYLYMRILSEVSKE